MRCPARCNSRSSPTHQPVCDRRRPHRTRGRTRRADQHRVADLLLRDLRRAAPRPGDRPDQGCDREKLRQTRSRRVARNQARGRPLATGAAPHPGTRARHGHPGAAAAGPGAGTTVRPHRHRANDGRARRRPTRQRASRGRHVPQRNRGLRETQHLRAGRGVGSRLLHPMRQLQLRLPAQRYPLPLLRPVRLHGGRRRHPVLGRWGAKPEERSQPTPSRWRGAATNM